MAQPALKAEKRFTYADYKHWPADERWELHDGRAVAMSPAPTVQHQVIAGNFHHWFKNFLKGKPCRVYISPIDVLLPTYEGQDAHEVDRVLQPDVIVVCDREKIRKANIFGAPDLAIEVLSPSTAKRDEGEKRDLYARAGVKELWLADPENLTVKRYALVDGEYRKPDVFGPEDALPSSALEGVTLPLGEIFEVDLV